MDRGYLNILFDKKDKMDGCSFDSMRRNVKIKTTIDFEYTNELILEYTNA